MYTEEYSFAFPKQEKDSAHEIGQAFYNKAWEISYLADEETGQIKNVMKIDGPIDIMHEINRLEQLLRCYDYRMVQAAYNVAMLQLEATGAFDPLTPEEQLDAICADWQELQEVEEEEPQD